MKTLCKRTDLAPNSSLGIDRYILVDRDGKLYIYHNSCPHRGIPLEWQANQFLDPSKQFIQCASHGALFSIDSGLCIKGPCNGQSLTAASHTIEQENIIIIN